LEPPTSEVNEENSSPVEQSEQPPIATEEQNAEQPEIGCKDEQATVTAIPVWTRDQVEKDWRRFNLDLAPKVTMFVSIQVSLYLGSVNRKI
jgi:hypothetical protein